MSMPQFTPHEIDISGHPLQFASTDELNGFGASVARCISREFHVALEEISVLPVVKRGAIIRWVAYLPEGQPLAREEQPL